MFGQAEVEERFKFLGDVRIRIAGVEALQHAELEGAFAVLVPEGLQPLVRVKPRRQFCPVSSNELIVDQRVVKHAQSALDRFCVSLVAQMKADSLVDEKLDDRLEGARLHALLDGLTLQLLNDSSKKPIVCRGGSSVSYGDARSIAFAGRSLGVSALRGATIFMERRVFYDSRKHVPAP